MNSSGVADRLERRRFLGLLASAGAAGVAGCGAVDSDGTNVGNSTSAIGRNFPHDPANYQLNPWAPGYTPGFPSMLFEPLSVDVHGRDRELADLVTDLEIERNSATVRFSEAFSWWSGDPVTARDRWIAHRIDDLLGVRNRWTDVTLVDDYTLEYTFETPLRRRIALDTVVGTILDTPAWVFAEWRDRLADASTDSRRRSVAEDLQTTAIRPKRAMNDGIGCGPYEISEVSINRIMFERFEDHPRAADISVPRAWFPVAGDQQAHGLARDGLLDIGEGHPAGDSGIDVPDYIEELARYRTDFGPKLSFNWAAPHVGRRNVRRAFLCAIPLDGIADHLDWGHPMSVQTGLSVGAAEEWLGPLREELHAYPVERDREAAREYLRRAGYERRGGDWIGPEGHTLEVRLRAPRWGGWEQFGQEARTTLIDVGFDVTLSTAGVTTFGSLLESNGYDAIAWWTQGTPFSAYNVHDESLTGLGYGVTDPDTERSARDKPVEPTIPSEPGALQVDGDGRRINLVELWEELRRPISEERTREIVRLFARWWNYDLPDLHLTTRSKRVWGNTRDFDWPAEGSDIYRHAGPQNSVDYNLIRTGAIRSKEADTTRTRRS